MRLTKEAIEEFQKLYEEEFGEQLSFEEAEIRGRELVELYKMLAEPLPSERDEPTPPDDPPPSAG